MFPVIHCAAVVVRARFFLPPIIPDGDGEDDDDTDDADEGDFA
jgi:hypothetical protein